MKYLFISDIHGSLTRLREVLHFFDSENYDMLCLIGDVINYGPRNSLPDGLDGIGVAEMLNNYADRIVGVRGNCDSEVDQMLLHFPILYSEAMLVIEGVRFRLAHGHLLPEDAEMRHRGCEVLMTGHTHLWQIEQCADGVVECNIGSPTFPKGGREATFATYEEGILSVRSLKGDILKSIVIPQKVK